MGPSFRLALLSCVFLVTGSGLDRGVGLAASSQVGSEAPQVHPAEPREKAVGDEQAGPAAPRLGEGEILSSLETSWEEAAGLCDAPALEMAPGLAGRLLTLRVEGRTRRVFVVGGEVVECENPEVMAIETHRLDPDLAEAVEAARRDLADRLDTPLESVAAVRSEKVTWRDSSLGCPDPDRVYLQVLIPGARMVLEVDGKRYVYHLAEGGEPLFCAEPSPPPPLPAIEIE